MAHWRNGSVFQGLRQFSRYGVRRASVNQPTGPIQQIEDFQGADTQAGGLFPVHVKKNIGRIRGRGRLSVRDKL